MLQVFHLAIKIYSKEIIRLLVQCVTRLDVGLLVEVVVGGGRVGLTIKDK